MEDTPPAAPWSERVKRERALQGRSWTSLSKEAGVARSTIDKWATQMTPPQPQTVSAMADALGIPRVEALRLAGILVEAEAEQAQATLQEISDEALAAEVARRLTRSRVD